jgi:hypothetical protein
MENNRALERFLIGIGTGAAVMCLFDPDRGNRRRAILTDKASSLANQLPVTLDKTGRDLSNRA